MGFWRFEMDRAKKLVTSVIVSLSLVSFMGVMAQTQTDGQKTRQRTSATTKPAQDPASTTTADRLEPDDTRPRPSDVPQETEANRQEQLAEEAAIVPYYNNFFTTYRLGPEDVISVSVFNQDRYSRAGITVPPSGRISLSLIQGGIFVNGKTVDEVAELIKKKYDEYIIDPQVTVSLDKASSYRYSVIGDVGQPGIRLMSRRLTVTEALAEAGGVLSTGDKSKVVVLRRQADGVLSPIAVNVSAIYKGRAPDNTYLVPGDQIIVPGNKLKTLQKIMGFSPILSFARIFTGGLPF
jgi:protein involved in polysaccharide export with SLBB domain